MAQWSSRKKLVLVCLVSGSHFALLAGFNYSFIAGKPSTVISTKPQKLSILLRPTTDTTSTEAFPASKEQTKPTNRQAFDAQFTVSNQKSELPEVPNQSGFLNLDYFLDTDAVDKTAEPNDVFESQLAQLLPLNTQSVVLEFWIDKDGRPVEVRCIEGACTEEVAASLPKLTDLTFKPAVKNGEPVGNRKVIQIDTKPTFGM